MATPDLATRIAALKQTALTAQRLHVEAGSAQDFGRHQLDQIDADLTGMGIAPDNAEQELSALEAQLEVTVGQLEGQMAAEIAELTRILDLARQAHLVR